MNSNVYERITSKIVSDLEQGVRPWLKPWDAEHAAGLITRPFAPPLVARQRKEFGVAKFNNPHDIASRSVLSRAPLEIRFIASLDPALRATHVDQPLTDIQIGLNVLNRNGRSD